MTTPNIPSLTNLAQLLKHIEPEVKKDVLYSPKRRQCNFGPADSVSTIQKAKNAIFIDDEEIISIYPMKTSKDSPRNAISVTEEGKHVILQQSIKSADAACMAMLMQDHGEQLDFKNLQNRDFITEIADKENIHYRITPILKENGIASLSKCLKEKGPGILTIYHSTIDSHTFILDTISKENEATIRDPFHGWMIKIKLDALKALLKGGGSFFQPVWS